MSPGCSGWNPAGMLPKPTSGRGLMIEPLQSLALAWPLPAKLSPREGPAAEPPAWLLPGPRRKGMREGGHKRSAGSRHCCCDSRVRFSHVLLQLQPDVIFLIKWKLSTKTFCPQGIQILNVLLITVCKTLRKNYGNTFREKKSNYSCLKMLFWYLNFMNHPVWPNF